MTHNVKRISNLFIMLLVTSFLAACATVPTGSKSSSSSSKSDAYDSYSLTASAQATLGKQAKWLKANPSASIAIEGHADERGTREYNLALGDRRASSAKDYLMSQGISSNRISTISYGKERPVSNSSNDTSWSQNRRSVSVRTN